MGASKSRRIYWGNVTVPMWFKRLMLEESKRYKRPIWEIITDKYFEDETPHERKLIEEYYLDASEREV